VAISDKQFGLLEKRVRIVENTLAGHLATCNQSQQSVQRSIFEFKKEMSEVKDTCREIRTERDEARGAFKGIKSLFFVAISLVTVISVILNVYFLFNK